MAKALIAAVSLAVVLVAAVVVPLVVMPGISGFDDWPEATPRAPHEQVVSLPVPVQRAVRTERAKPPPAPRAIAPRQQLAVAPPRATAPAPSAGGGTEQVAPQQPQAAPEAPLPPPVVDARDHSALVPNVVSGIVQAGDILDGTNEP
jgi:hypothetical protein